MPAHSHEVPEARHAAITASFLFKFWLKKAT